MTPYTAWQRALGEPAGEVLAVQRQPQSIRPLVPASSGRTPRFRTDPNPTSESPDSVQPGPHTLRLKRHTLGEMALAILPEAA
jgi:hypothetical protein